MGFNFLNKLKILNTKEDHIKIILISIYKKAKT